MEIVYSEVIFNIDIENQIKLAHLIQEKIAKNIPLNEIERAFKEAQINEDKEDNKIFGR